MPELDVERIRRKTNRVKSDLEQLEGLHPAESIGRAQARRARERAAVAGEPLQRFPRWGDFPLS